MEKKRMIALVLVAMGLIAALVVLILWRNREQEIQVMVLRDSHSSFKHQQERRLLDFSARRPTTSHGKYITVLSVFPPHYQDFLASETALANMKPDLVVLDSPAQLDASPFMRRESTQWRNTCEGRSVCPAFIPSWVAGEKLEASKAVLEALVAGGPP